MIRATHPFLTIYTQTETLTLDEELISIQGSKSIDNLAGSFQINLQPVAKFGGIRTSNIHAIADLYRRISPMDVIILGWDRPFLAGFVDNVFYSKSGGPTARHSLTIRGRDLGKVFLQDSIIFAPIVGDEGDRFREVVRQTFGANHPLLSTFDHYWPDLENRMGETAFIAVPIQTALDTLLTRAFSLQIDTPGNILKTFYRDIKARSSDEVYLSGGGSAFDGSIANFLMRLLDKPYFYEAWVDTKLTQKKKLGDLHFPQTTIEAYLRVRPTPFDEEDMNFTGIAIDPQFGWDNLKTFVGQKKYHEISEEEIYEKHLGISDHEALSFYLCTLEQEIINTPYEEQKGLSFPILDIYSAKRYGLRSLKARSVHMRNTFTQPELTPDLLRYKRNQLFNWFRMNPEFVNGSITIPLNEEIRGGDRIALIDEIARDGSGGTTDPMLFYLPSYSYNWADGKEPMMTLNLNRGHTKGMIKSFAQKLILLSSAVKTQSTISGVNGVEEHIGTLFVDHIDA